MDRPTAPAGSPATVDRAVEVRAGRPADLAGALAAWEVSAAARDGRPVAPARRERTARSVADPGSFLVVATAPPGDELVGMALGVQTREDDGAGPPVPEHCHVSAVYVRPEWWGQRIGGRLVDAVLAEAVARGYRAAQLWTQADNERALRLYASRGFVRTGRSKLEAGEPIVHLTLDRLETGRDPGSR